MLKTVLMMYVTLLPVIIAGALNMAFCKSRFLASLSMPLDNEKTLRDGKRLFGDNKTYKGLLGYVVINMLAYIVWGFVCSFFKFGNLNFFYVNYPDVIIYNAFVGVLLGLAYALFELPNSFLKRRFDVVPGKTAIGKRKFFFVFLDQADSIIGCVLVLRLFYRMSVIFFVCYVLIGALTHIVVNLLLYALKLRKNII